MLSAATILTTIEERIKERGLTQSQFNRLAFGSDQTTAIQSLKGGSIPRVDRLEAMAKVLDLELYFGPPRTEADIPPAAGAEFALIPMYDAALAAGAGAVNGDNAPIAELAFQRKWLRSIGLRSENACVARAAGDSMVPTISSGDMLLIDRSKVEISVRPHVPDKRRQASIYALLIDNQARVKRIVRPDRNTLILLSDNPDNLPEVVTGERAEALAPTIIGQVRWSGHTLES